MAAPGSTPPRTRRTFLGLAGRAGAVGAVALTGSSVLAPARAGAEVLPEGSPNVGELGYAESVTPASTRTRVLLPNLVLAVGPSDRPMAVEYGGYLSCSVANGMAKLFLYRNGVVVNEIGGTVSGASGVFTARGLFRVPPTSTASTFSLALGCLTANATAVLCAYKVCPAFLLVRGL